MSNRIAETATVKDSRLSDGIKVFRDASVVDSALDDGVSIGDFSLIRHSDLAKKVEIGRRNTIDTARIGERTYTGEFCLIKHCTIGKYCSVSWNVSIGGANHDMQCLTTIPLHRVFDTPAEEYRSFREQPLTIGNDVWIGAGAHILRGVTVGDGAVIASNAVVTSNVAPYEIVGGVPARVIGRRFDVQTAEKLLALRWWDWPQEKLALARPLFEKPLDAQVLAQLQTISETGEG